MEKDPTYSTSLNSESIFKSKLNSLKLLQDTDESVVLLGISIGYLCTNRFRNQETTIDEEIRGKPIISINDWLILFSFK